MPRNAPRDLPAELALPLASGAEWWYWLGGRPALDLVNTRRERWARCVETLVTPRDLAGWLVEAGVVDTAPEVSRAVLREARALREAIDLLVCDCLPPRSSTSPAQGGETRRTPPAGVTAGVAAASGAGSSDGEGALALVDRWVARAGTRPALVLGPDGLPALADRGPADSPRRALGEIALDAARMLGHPEERARVRICASDTCSARFYDRSPAGRRRWCSMERCGNVAKARRHRARARSPR